MNDYKENESSEEGLFVDFAQTKMQRKMKFKLNPISLNERTNMYVRNVKGTVSEEEFKENLSRYGEITSVCLRVWKSKYQ